MSNGLIPSQTRMTMIVHFDSLQSPSLNLMGQVECSEHQFIAIACSIGIYVLYECLTLLLHSIFQIRLACAHHSYKTKYSNN